MTDEQLAKYVTKCKVKNLSEATISGYSISLKQFQQWLNNVDRSLETLTDDDIDDYIVYLKNRSGTMTTVNDKLRDIRAFINFSVERGWRAPIKIKLLKIDEPEIIPFTDEQLSEIYDACRGSKQGREYDKIRDYTIMRLMEDTGIRLGECARLELNDIDMREDRIRLSKTKNRQVRYIYLTSSMKKELKIYLDARAAFMKNNGIKENQNLWLASRTTEPGKPVAARTLEGKITRYGELAGIPIRVSPHTFRHTFARNYIINGGDIYHLKELLGHSSLEMVLKYVRLFGKDRQNNYLKVMERREKERKKGKLKKV